MISVSKDEAMFLVSKGHLMSKQAKKLHKDTEIHPTHCRWKHYYVAETYKILAELKKYRDSKVSFRYFGNTDTK